MLTDLMMTDKNPYIVCFGEVLWDIFPEGSRAGGVPFNVAYNVHKMDIDVNLFQKELKLKIRKIS